MFWYDIGIHLDEYAPFVQTAPNPMIILMMELIIEKFSVTGGVGSGKQLNYLLNTLYSITGTIQTTMSSNIGVNHLSYLLT